MTDEKIYIIGASGNIGEKVTQRLLAKGIPTTIYIRDPSKGEKLFQTNKEHLTIVKGDYNDFTPFEKSISGHTRLFLLIADLDNMPEYKEKLAKIAYEAQVKQIVDLSSRFAQFDWRTSAIGEAHRLSEEKIYHLALKYSKKVVSLRPTRFFTNHLWVDLPTIQKEKAIYSSQPPNEKVEWVSIDDIADLAVIVLTDPIEKHGNLAYPIISDSVDGRTRAEIVSKYINQKVEYKQVASTQAYHTMISNNVPPLVALDIATVYTPLPPGEVAKVLLGRDYETLDQWFEKNKEKFI